MPTIEAEFQLCLTILALGGMDCADKSGEHVGEGMRKHAMGDIKGAIKAFDKAILHNPTNANAYFLRGQSKARLQQYAAAIKDYNKVIALGP